MNWLTQWVILCEKYLRRRHAQTVRDGASSHKIDYVY